MKFSSGYIGSSFLCSQGRSSGCVGGSWAAFLMVKGLLEVARLYSSIWSVASWMSTYLLIQLIVGFTLFNQGSPRMMLSFPHLMA